MIQRRTIAWRWLLIGGTLVLLMYVMAACLSPGVRRSTAGGVVGLEATSVQPGDEITIDQSTRDVTAYITSEKGIGRIDLKREGTPPETLTLYFELKGLEEMTWAWEDTLVTAHVSSTDGSVHEELVLSGGKTSPISDASPYWMPVRIDTDASTEIPLESGYFVVNAPKAFLEGAPEHFSLRWIDFYR